MFLRYASYISRYVTECNNDNNTNFCSILFFFLFSIREEVQDLAFEVSTLLMNKLHSQSVLDTFYVNLTQAKII